MPHILILEDEASISESLRFCLEQERFSTHCVTYAEEGLAYLRTHQVDLAIFDVGLPDMSGFEACKQLRSFSRVPVIFLTARSDELDRVVGLEIGADDYVVKPFSPRELAARVKAILRRVTPVQSTFQPAVQSAESNETITPLGHADFVLDRGRMSVTFFGSELTLTPVEFKLLGHFLSQPKRVFSRDQLLAVIGVSVDAGYERSIDTHIKSIRAKLRKINAEVDPIKTQRGFGYSYQPRSSSCL